MRARGHDAKRQPESTRPPRYRLLTAAAALPPRPPAEPTQAFVRDCPACGRPVAFTQVHGDTRDTGVDYVIEDHECDGLSSGS